MPGLSAFFGLRGQDACGLIALKASILVERGVAWIDNRRGIGSFFVVGFASNRRSQIADFARVFVHQQQVFIRMRFLLPAVMLRLGKSILGTLAAALRPSKRHIGGARQCQGTGGDSAGVACWRHVERGSGALQDGQQVMNPGVGLGLAQLELQAMHGLQRMSLLKDENEKQFVFHLWQGPCGSTTDPTLARLARQGLVRRIQCGIGGRKRWEQTRKLCVRQSGRSEELSRSVL